MTARTHLLLIALLFLAVSLPIISLAQTTNESTLSPKAQAAVKKGLDAAKQQEWNVAIRYFSEARQAAPDSPVPLINLGLAESQLPGHELRAICWFEAYLILVPTVVNAPAVRQQISNLETRAEGNADKIIEMLKVLMGQMPSSDYWALWGVNADLAGLLAASGDLDAAGQIVQNQSNTDIQNHAREAIVEAFVNLKRIPDAIAQASQITNNSSDAVQAYQSIFSAQVAAGSFSDAKRSATNFVFSGDFRLKLADAEYQAGQSEDAAELLRDERASIDKENDGSLRENDLAKFAAGEYMMGMHEDADTMFQQIKEYAYNTKGDLSFRNNTRMQYGDRMVILVDLAKAEEQIGRHSIALQLMSEAEKACLAARKANEDSVAMFDNTVLVLYGYYALNDWDRAQSWIYQNHDAGEKIFDYKYYGMDFNLRKSAAVATDSYDSAKTASIKILADATASSAQRAQAWSDYIKGCLIAPLFTTDFKITMAGLVSFTPSAEEQGKSQTIFDHVKQPAADLIAKLNDIHELEGVEISSTAAQSQNQPAAPVSDQTGKK
jgi:hypothetical protein